MKVLPKIDEIDIFFSTHAELPKFLEAIQLLLLVETKAKQIKRAALNPIKQLFCANDKGKKYFFSNNQENFRHILESIVDALNSQEQKEFFLKKIITILSNLLFLISKQRNALRIN
jgi:pyrroloquinoline quinone (PQQ) biosynthesis protein C